MRAIITGQVGLDKKPYLEGVAALAAEQGVELPIYHVGDRMYKEAPDVRPGRILDLPLSRLHTIRRSVLKDVIKESEGQENLIINTHATFRWRHGLFRAFDFDQMEQLKPDLLICLLDNVETVWQRLRDDHYVDATLKDLMVWREEEIMATELLALALGCVSRCYIVPRGRYEPTTKLCFQLVCRYETRKAYVSFPMSHVVGMPDVQAEIDEFRRGFGDLIVFDPSDVDEKQLLEAAIAATKEGRDFVEGRTMGPEGTSEIAPISARQILEVSYDIDGQIYARDFQLIDQSDMIISFVPELAGGVPGLSSGVERELQHAYEHGKEVFVVWKPKREPSPFITETATKVFRSIEEALAHLAGPETPAMRSPRA